MPPALTEGFTRIIERVFDEAGRSWLAGFPELLGDCITRRELHDIEAQPARRLDTASPPY